MSKKAAFIRNIAEVPWKEYPGHFGGALPTLPGDAEQPVRDASSRLK